MNLIISIIRKIEERVIELYYPQSRLVPVKVVAVNKREGI